MYHWLHCTHEKNKKYGWTRIFTHLLHNEWNRLLPLFLWLINISWFPFPRGIHYCVCLPEPESPTRKRRNMYQRVDTVWDEQCASASGAVDWHELSTSCFSVRNTMPPSRCKEQNSSSLPYHCTCTLKMLSCQAENFLSFNKSYTHFYNYVGVWDIT